MAVSGARLRIMALSSLVATTATVFAMLLGPIVSSRNSRTSRPRSPTSATTTVSKAVGAGQHGEQRRLADAGAGEDAEPLAETDRREDVDDPHAGRERRCRRAGGTAPMAALPVRRQAASPCGKAGPPSIGAGQARRWRGPAMRHAAPRRSGPRLKTASPTPASALRSNGATSTSSGAIWTISPLRLCRHATALLDDVAEPRDRRKDRAPGSASATPR